MKEPVKWPKEKRILEEKAVVIRRCPDEIRDFLVSYVRLTGNSSCAKQALLLLKRNNHIMPTSINLEVEKIL